ncbi:MAG: MarR family transcriptional regulator [Anaerofustis stercorihominis]|nr:MarR family transcriptional regulator [Anaerofustis stercorihominis]
MTMEQKLMRNLMKACAATRRRPHKTNENQNRPGHSHNRARGAGHILEMLSVSEGILQQQIADTLNIRPQSVSEAVSKLEHRGLVCKKTSDEDKRKTLVYLTEEGLSHRDSMKKDREEHERSFFSVLTDEEKTQLLYLLEKINSVFCEDKENK